MTTKPALTKVDGPAELGKLVQNARRTSGVDQRTAAGLAGVGTRFLSDLENGKPTAQLGLVLQVLDRLGHIRRRAERVLQSLTRAA